MMFVNVAFDAVFLEPLLKIVLRRFVNTTFRLLKKDFTIITL